MVTIHRNKKGASAEKTQSQSQIYGFFPFRVWNKGIRTMVFAICFLVNCLQVQGLEQDSTKEYSTKPILKEGKKSNDYLEYGRISTKKSLNPSVIDMLGNGRLQSIALLLPSIELRDYGGPGSMSLFSIRGLGPMRNMILLDGIPMSSSQTGVFDMSSLPLMSGQTIDIDVGGASSFVGSGAMSGMIELLPPSLKDTSFCSIKGGIGSFGEHSASIQSGYGNSHTTVLAMADHFQFDGGFPIQFQPAGNVNQIQVERQNAGNIRQHIFSRVSHYFQESQTNASLWTSLTKGERGVPGAVLTGKIESTTATLTEQDIMIAGSVQTVINTQTQIRLRGSLRNSQSLFKDPFALFAGINGASNAFTTSDLFTHAEVVLHPKQDIVLSSGLMLSHTRLRGDLLQPFAKGEPMRTSGALFSRILTEQSGYTIDIGCRTDMFSDQQGPVLSGHAILSKDIVEECSISAKLTRDFRVPSFNELYYLNYGTQYLVPELSTGIDIGLSYHSSNLSGQCSFYHMSVQDQILAIPISPVQWSARNIGLVWSSGVEASLNYRLPAIRSEIQISYSYKSVLDKRSESPTFNTMMPYTPKHTLSCSMISDFTTHAFGILVSGIGERFGLLGELAESRLYPILLINPFIEYRKIMFLGIFKLRAEIRNILNTSYQMILNFPLPRRSFAIQCGITL